MKQKKFMYEKPTMQVVELKSRGILMASGQLTGSRSGGDKNYGDSGGEEEWP